MEFQELFAETEYIDRYYGQISDPYDKVVLHCFMSIYGIPESLSEESVETILNGDKEQAVQIGEVTGLLILGSQAEKADMDIYDICDCVDGYAELIYSALSEGDGPLSDYENPYSDVFCIDDISLNDEYDTEPIKLRVLENLPKFVFGLYHVIPDIIADHPKPLPYEKPLYQQIKEDMAKIAFVEMQKPLFGEPQEATDIKFTLDEEQRNYILGRRNTGETYPESAKEMPVWELYAKAGFIEHRNTRVLYRLTDSDLFY